LGLTQTAMAADLGVSPSYLNHLERNQRPLTAQMLLRLAQVYEVDLKSLGGGSDDAEAELTEAFSDPLLRDLAVPRHELLQLADDAPAATAAVLRLYRELSESRRREALMADAGAPAGAAASPGDWVRDYIQAHGNHYPDLDLLGEALHATLAPEPHGLDAAARTRLADRHGVTVRVMPAPVMVEWTRRFDPHRRRLLLSERLGPRSRAFAVLFQLVLLEHGDAIEARVVRAAALDPASEAMLRVSLTNSLAAAVLMPYGEFHAAAEETGYDIAALQARFGSGFEQTAHRLTTMGRPGARGVPLFFIRVDQAGNVSKRFASEAFPFSRFGGACPRWRLHSAFRTPGRIQTQIVETRDGERYFTLARTVRRPLPPYDGGEEQDLAVGLGCELKHAHRLAYARGLDLVKPVATEIGPTCRLCDRHPCRERAAPPIGRVPVADEWAKSISPFPFQKTPV
ncbi:MAG TPA: short-chain fatty acyl-CoA regulator family protein, partial [Caulobacteraceae bacterium]